jgi:hypothetical protein
MMNMTRVSHRGSVDGNGQVRHVDHSRWVPIGERRRGQTTATKLSRPRRIVDLRSEAARMIELICELFPLCRSITGDGLRQSLYRLGELIPLETHEVASGTQTFDWTIPKEWNIKDGYKHPDWTPYRTTYYADSWASACRTDSSKALRTPNMRWLSTHRATELSLMESASSPAGSRMNS